MHRCEESGLELQALLPFIVNASGDMLLVVVTVVRTDKSRLFELVTKFAPGCKEAGLWSAAPQVVTKFV